MAGKVVWHVGMSLDGFIESPDHSMDWWTGYSLDPSVTPETTANLGAILSGRRGFDQGVAQGIDVENAAYGGAWSGPLLVLTHHAEDITETYEKITFIDCDIAEAVRLGLEAANGKNLELFGADIARQAVEAELVDEFYVHLVPVMLGDGLRLFDAPGRKPVRWERIHDGDPYRTIDLRFRPATTAA